MGKALIIGGGVAGPVARMALQRAGIEAVVYEAHPQTAEEVGSYLTVASNGLDALRAIDAVVPAKCLRDQPDIPQALEAYEQLRRWRVQRIVAQGARTSSTKTLGPAGRILRDLLLPLVFKFLVTDKSMAGIYGHHIDWDARSPSPSQPDPTLTPAARRPSKGLGMTITTTRAAKPTGPLGGADEFGGAAAG